MSPGKARQAASGFAPTACAGRERISDGAIPVLLTAPLAQSTSLASRVNGAQSAFERPIKRGARPVAPTLSEDRGGNVMSATLARSALLASDRPGIGMEAGTLNEWVDFYRQIPGSERSHQEELVALQGPSGSVPCFVQEPGRHPSPIEAYLAADNGPGVQRGRCLPALYDQALRDRGGIEEQSAVPACNPAMPVACAVEICACTLKRLNEARHCVRICKRAACEEK
ncbi:MAG TPA: hypothetical protein VGF67_06700 [Ktedonobacteraceae bacterium]